MSVPHPVLDVPDVKGTIRFLHTEAMRELPVPWPRCQDLDKKCFGVPTKDDLVLAVSHAWPYGAHPDPVGNKGSAITELVDEARQSHMPKGKTLVFTDFLSVSQRPYAAWQAERTLEEEAAFARALRAFPMVYLQADAVLHIDVPVPPLRADGQVYHVRLEDLEGVKLRLLGKSVHVVGYSEKLPNPKVAPFDIIDMVDETEIHCLEDLDSIRDVHAERRNAVPDLPWWWMASVPCCHAREETIVRMRRAPFGIWSSLNADEKGWVFLERFTSMVKVALVPEDQASGVAFATSARLKAEVLNGGRKLREAAAKGQEELNQALDDYLTQLDSKLFTATSMDKATNNGGVGGVLSPSSRTPRSRYSERQQSDREVVARLMRDLIDYLRENWAKEQQAQRQRQLALSVCCGDLQSCRQLIAAGADPNVQDALGLTCLHSAARFRDLAMTRLLVEQRAELVRQDLEGNCAAHRLVLYAEELTVSLFQVLAPTEEVLGLTNNAGVQPFTRFVAWAVTAVESRPYGPANDLIEELRKRYPSLTKRKALGRFRHKQQVERRVKEDVIEHEHRGRSIKLSVWQDPETEPDFDVLYVGMAMYVPWCMQRDAVGVVAAHWCCRHPVRVIAFGVDAIAPGVSEKPIGELQAHVAEFIQGLPLREQFFLAENSGGVCSHLIWRLQERIQGALIVNPLGWFSDDFYNSEAHQGMTKVLKRHSDIFRRHDLEGATKIVGSFLFAESAEEVTKVQERYAAALSSASDQFWMHASQSTRLCMTEATPQWKNMGLLPKKVPLVLACGAFSPSLVVQETTARIKSVAPYATISYIPDSKQWWEQEGNIQTMAVAHLFNGVLNEHAPSIAF